VIAIALLVAVLGVPSLIGVLALALAPASRPAFRPKAHRRALREARSAGAPPVAAAVAMPGARHTVAWVTIPNVTSGTQLGHLPDAPATVSAHDGDRTEIRIIRTGPLPAGSVRELTMPNRPAHPAYQLLSLLDTARGASALPFATDPQAAALDRRARELADEYWPNALWLTGNISRALLDAVTLRLEAERQALHTRVRVFVATEPSSVPRA
jgi:hypothetical protein